MISKIIVVGWTVFVAWSFLSGIADISKTTDQESTVFAFAVAFSIVVHLCTWLLVALPTFVISRMFQKKAA